MNSKQAPLAFKSGVSSANSSPAAASSRLSRARGKGKGAMAMAAQDEPWFDEAKAAVLMDLDDLE